MRVVYYTLMLLVNKQIHKLHPTHHGKSRDKWDCDDIRWVCHRLGRMVFNLIANSILVDNNLHLEIRPVSCHMVTGPRIYLTRRLIKSIAPQICICLISLHGSNHPRQCDHHSHD